MISRSWDVTTPNTQPLVPVSDLRDHSQIGHLADDARLAGLEAAAVGYAEAYTRRLFLLQTITVTQDCFPYGSARVYLPRALNAGVVSVKYDDAAGSEVTMAAADFQEGVNGKAPFICPAPGEVWPTTEAGRVGAVRIEYQVGWATPAAVPPRIVLAVKQLVGHWYENGEPVLIGSSAKELPFQVKALLAGWRVLEIH